MTAVVLLHAAFPDALVEQLRLSYDVIGPVSDVALDLPLAVRYSVRALMTHGMMRTDKALMEVLPNLRVICCWGSGVEGVDLDAAACRGIAVVNSLGANATSVADLIIALAMALTRGIVPADRVVRSGRWQHGGDKGVRPAKEFSEYKIGIYGLGAIGLQVAEKANKLGNEVSYHGRKRRPNLCYGYFESLQNLALWADILVLSVRAVEENRQAVGAPVLGALGPAGYLINVARGWLVDMALLEEYLADGRLAGAALDVYDVEPCFPSGLARLSNTILTPHLGAHTLQAYERMNLRAVENIKAVLG